MFIFLILYEALYTKKLRSLYLRSFSVYYSFLSQAILKMERIFQSNPQLILIT